MREKDARKTIQEVTKMLEDGIAEKKEMMERAELLNEFAMADYLEGAIDASEVTLMAIKGRTEE